MKLIKSQKKDKGRNQAQELYPKVKTFSKAYDFAPKKEEKPVAPSGDTPFFALDERPYPTAASPANLPVIPNKSSDYNDPERIDLQDTLLTDESFGARAIKHPASVSDALTAEVPDTQNDPEELSPADENSEIREPEEVKAEPAEEDSWNNEEPDQPESPEESEEEDIPEPFFEYEAEADEADTDYAAEPEIGTETPYESEPEAEYEADSFFEPEEDADSDLETDTESDLFPESDPDDVSGVSGEPDEESYEPFSWFDSDADLLPDGDTGIAFKKKKYTAVIGKKNNLRKKLRSKPEGTLKWKSSDPKVAKVSRKGILKPKKKGKVVVRVKAKGGERAKVKIRITSAKKAKKKTLPWENIGTEKKAASDKKWARFA